MSFDINKYLLTTASTNGSSVTAASSIWKGSNLVNETDYPFVDEWLRSYADPPPPPDKADFWLVVEMGSDGPAGCWAGSIPTNPGTIDPKGCPLPMVFADNEIYVYYRGVIDDAWKVTLPNGELRTFLYTDDRWYVIYLQNEMRCMSGAVCDA